MCAKSYSHETKVNLSDIAQHHSETANFRHKNYENSELVQLFEALSSDREFEDSVDKEESAAEIIYSKVLNLHTQCKRCESLIEEYVQLYNGWKRHVKILTKEDADKYQQNVLLWESTLVSVKEVLSNIEYCLKTRVANIKKNDERVIAFLKLIDNLDSGIYKVITRLLDL